MRQEGRLGSNGGASALGIAAPKKRLVCIAHSMSFKRLISCPQVGTVGVGMPFYLIHCGCFLEGFCKFYARVSACTSQIINGKPVERRLGDWAQMKSSKGKVYFFHLKTQVSQWVEPADWKELEEKERLEEEEDAAARLASLQGCVH